MPLEFRNLTISPDDPVATWPTEAVLIAIDRGDLHDWQRIVAELRRDPWGHTARQVEEVLGHSRPYGIGDAFQAVLERIRARPEESE